MYKKFLIISILLCMCLGLTGCGNQIPELSDSDMTLVTTYAATLLLKYDKNYQSNLLNDEKLAEEEEIQRQIDEDAKRLAEREAQKEAAKQEKENAKNESDKNSSNVDEVSSKKLSDILELNGLSVSCNGIHYTNQYPENTNEMVFMVNASNGCDLAVVELYLVNNSGSDQTINMFEKNAKFKVSINGGEYHSAMQMTVLDDEFSAYTGTISNGQSVPVVLLVDLPEEECVTASEITLSVKYKEGIVKTKIY